MDDAPARVVLHALLALYAVRKWRHLAYIARWRQRAALAAPTVFTVRCLSCTRWTDVGRPSDRPICRECAIDEGTCEECGGIGVHLGGCPNLLDEDYDLHRMAMDIDIRDLDDDTHPPPPAARE